MLRKFMAFLGVFNMEGAEHKALVSLVNFLNLLMITPSSANLLGPRSRLKQ